MSNQEHLSILQQSTLSDNGMKEWNQWREANPSIIPDLSEAVLISVNLGGANFNKANFREAILRETNLSNTSFVDAVLTGADLTGAGLIGVNLTNANLSATILYRANFEESVLDGTNLRAAKFDSDTQLYNVRFSDRTILGDVRWNNVDITAVRWSLLHSLGDNKENWYGSPNQDTIKSRANRQVANLLRSQGLESHADRFAYRAHVYERSSLFHTNIFLSIPWFGSLFLDLISGYGYKPGRIFIAYLFVISAFAGGYYAIGQTSGPHLSMIGAFVFSITSFHGRGFFPGGIALDDPLTILAAIEAIVGLIIEVTFIATFTQRFFGK